jgi:hypothetical protein
MIYQDNSSKQKIYYLTTINESPTTVSVVLETMRQAQKLAEEFNEDYMEVTYDLAIAKVALQIQSMETSQFDNLFIHFGSFHIMMAYFKAIGKLIGSYGITNIMVNTDILASGSINSFILASFLIDANIFILFYTWALKCYTLKLSLKKMIFKCLTILTIIYYYSVKKNQPVQQVQMTK